MPARPFTIGIFPYSKFLFFDPKPPLSLKIYFGKKIRRKGKLSIYWHFQLVNQAAQIIFLEKNIAFKVALYHEFQLRIKRIQLTLKNYVLFNFSKSQPSKMMGCFYISRRQCIGLSPLFCYISFVVFGSCNSATQYGWNKFLFLCFCFLSTMPQVPMLLLGWSMNHNRRNTRNPGHQTTICLNSTFGAIWTCVIWITSHCEIEGYIVILARKRQWHI